MNSLVPPSRKSNEPALTASDIKPDPAIAEALHCALAAFAVQRNLSDADRAANIKSYRRAMVGFRREIIISSLDYLTLHNPRNPFPFTAQDLFERMKFEAEAWDAHALSELIGNGGPIAFRLHSRHLPDFGGRPLTSACVMPDDYIIGILRKYATRRYLKLFVDAPQDLLDALPPEALPDDLRAEIGRQRLAKVEQEARSRAYRADYAKRWNKIARSKGWVCMEEIDLDEPPQGKIQN